MRTFSGADDKGEPRAVTGYAVELDNGIERGIADRDGQPARAKDRAMLGWAAAEASPSRWLAARRKRAACVAAPSAWRSARRPSSRYAPAPCAAATQF
jgi:hypothetical protein